MRIFFLAILSAIVVSSCTQTNKDLATVEIGMTKSEVSGSIGEPKTKNVVNNTEVWDYADSGRTVVFRKDTVYSIMTSPRARLDSMKVWVDSADNKTKKVLGKVGEKLNNAGDKLENAAGKVGVRLKRDTSKSN
ncbi:MAG TPA: outer membrane protein assembly factor BamE [Pedobacter sp.]|jgi:outer membrane protein assembly factor BamE (lipoprotein component of BamABCDE complex)